MGLSRDRAVPLPLDYLQPGTYCTYGSRVPGWTDSVVANPELRAR